MDRTLVAWTLGMVCVMGTVRPGTMRPGTMRPGTWLQKLRDLFLPRWR